MHGGKGKRQRESGAEVSEQKSLSTCISSRRPALSPGATLSPTAVSQSSTNSNLRPVPMTWRPPPWTLAKCPAGGDSFKYREAGRRLDRVWLCHSKFLGE